MKSLMKLEKNCKRSSQIQFVSYKTKGEEYFIGDSRKCIDIEEAFRCQGGGGEK